MHERWIGLWRDDPVLRPCALRHEARLRQIGADLLARYAESARVYHNTDHLADCLDTFDAARRLARQPTAVVLAIWLHDVIYDPRRSDNEAQSAAYARRILTGVGCPADVIDPVACLIDATRHVGPPPGGDAALLRDIDLAVFGRPEPAYRRYAQQIRAEYAWVEASVYREERSRVLRRFLERPSLYETAWFHDRYEARARRNLTAELHRLAQTDEGCQTPPQCGQ